MCGIAVWIASQYTTLADSKIDHAVNKIKHRGPDESRTLIVDEKCRLDFHRLQINGLDAASMQPFRAGPWHVVVNGEIYNSDALVRAHELQTVSGSDCEVVARLFQAGRDPSKICDLLDGVYAFVAYNEVNHTLVAARDPFGVRSLFISTSHGGFGPRLALASEFKALSAAGAMHIAPFPPGKLFRYNLETGLERWQRHHVGFESRFFPLFSVDDAEAMERLRTKLVTAVQKRVTCDRLPIGCFVSGGVDSSLVAALVVQAVVANGGFPEDVWTFSIGQEGATDLAYARMVADHLKTTHHEVHTSQEEMLAAIPGVIRDLETWDTTTVRAATGHTLLATYIQKNTPVKVLFSGEGADEIMGSYLYFSGAPSTDAFQEESLRLCRDLHRYDVLRVELSCASRGLECRVPFLDKAFVATALRIPPQQRGFRDYNGGTMEKWLLRQAFDGSGLLPPEVLWRRKEAFSDGVSSASSSWHHQIKTHAATMFPPTSAANKENEFTPEQQWYRHVFNTHFPGCHAIIPYEWLPKWTDQKDPSARALPQYQ